MIQFIGFDLATSIFAIIIGCFLITYLVVGGGLYMIKDDTEEVYERQTQGQEQPYKADDDQDNLISEEEDYEKVKYSIESSQNGVKSRTIRTTVEGSKKSTFYSGPEKRNQNGDRETHNQNLGRVDGNKDLDYDDREDMNPAYQQEQRADFGRVTNTIYINEKNTNEPQNSKSSGNNNSKYKKNNKNNRH